MNSLTTETGYVSLNKKGEQLCGDRVEIIQNNGQLTFVLADGLGSGVKANILSTLTSKIIATMMAGGLALEDCVETIASTLPVCSERHIAYSTFTIIQVDNNEKATIIQFDNPRTVFLRHGKNTTYPVIEKIIDSKKIYTSTILLQPGDIFVAMSDGAIYAGVGQSMNFGWQLPEIIDYLELRYDPSLSAKMVATILAEECDNLYGHEPGDDTTVGVVKIRKRQPVNLIIGPPKDPADLAQMHELFLSKEGKRIVCGGTTSELIAQRLGKTVRTELDYPDPTVPPIGHIPGVDLVTEGVLTISRVLEYARAYDQGTDLSTPWANRRDGASLIAQMLFEDATDIHFFVGTAINPAHQNPDLPIHFAIKIGIIKELAECLEKMGKSVQVSYF